MAHTSLAIISHDLGNYEKALSKSRTECVLSYALLGLSYQFLNRFDEADAVYKQADDRKLESELLFGNRYELAFLKGDAAVMERFASGAMGKPGIEDYLLAEQSDT